MRKFEAERCLRCQDPICIDGCPVAYRFPISCTKLPRATCAGAAKFCVPPIHCRLSAAASARRKSQCEEQCLVGIRFNPVAIGYLERFVADWEMGQPPVEVTANLHRPEKVAIIGSGPAGLVCAGELARLGHPVTIFEALHAPGGVLRYGIPEFRLPKDVLDWEIEQLKRLGVEIQCNVIIGKTIAMDELMGEMGFSAVFVGTGAGLPQLHGNPGREPEWRVLGQRVPDARQPDARQRFPEC